jgi:5-methylcytosine-specific restriction endonuclease McrA
MSRKLTTYRFIADCRLIHGDRYDYSLVEYITSHIKVKIICLIHGVFEQSPYHHKRGINCPKCSGKYRTTKDFIDSSVDVHGDRYDYSLVEYTDCLTKVKIICPIHGVFEQKAISHLRGMGCYKCGVGDGKCYKKNNIPLYNSQYYSLQPYGIQCRRSVIDENILEVRCWYCNKWFIPSRSTVQSKIQSIKGNLNGESNLYCSYGCKNACGTYYQKVYSKDDNRYDKKSTSREVQPQLRKLVLERDNWVCQKCDSSKELHCHHFEGIEINPVESADVDNCVTLCKKCHKAVHKQDGCNMKRERC